MIVFNINKIFFVIINWKNSSINIYCNSVLAMALSLVLALNFI